jgi:hypothetical protein
MLAGIPVDDRLVLDLARRRPVRHGRGARTRLRRRTAGRGANDHCPRGDSARARRLSRRARRASGRLAERARVADWRRARRVRRLNQSNSLSPRGRRSHTHGRLRVPRTLQSRCGAARTAREYHPTCCMTFRQRIRVRKALSQPEGRKGRMRRRAVLVPIRRALHARLGPVVDRRHEVVERREIFTRGACSRSRTNSAASRLAWSRHFASTIAALDATTARNVAPASR